MESIALIAWTCAFICATVFFQIGRTSQRLIARDANDTRTLAWYLYEQGKEIKSTVQQYNELAARALRQILRTQYSYFESNFDSLRRQLNDLTESIDQINGNLRPHTETLERLNIAIDSVAARTTAQQQLRERISQLETELNASRLQATQYHEEAVAIRQNQQETEDALIQIRRRFRITSPIPALPDYPYQIEQSETESEAPVNPTPPPANPTPPLEAWEGRDTWSEAYRRTHPENENLHRPWGSTDPVEDTNWTTSQPPEITQFAFPLQPNFANGIRTREEAEALNTAQLPYFQELYDGTPEEIYTPPDSPEYIPEYTVESGKNQATINKNWLKRQIRRNNNKRRQRQRTTERISKNKGQKEELKEKYVPVHNKGRRINKQKQVKLYWHNVASGSTRKENNTKTIKPFIETDLIVSSSSSSSVYQASESSE